MKNHGANDPNSLPDTDPDDDPDDFLLPTGLRRFNRPGFIASLIGTLLVAFHNVTALLGLPREGSDEDEDELFDPSARFVDGLIASLVATLVVFPLDVVKTRQQMTRPWEPVCAGIGQCFRQIQRKEGIRGLFRGATIVLVMTTPEKALKQVSNEYFRHLMANQGDKRGRNGEISLKEEVFAGFVTGLLPMLVNSPADMIKGYLQDAGRLEKPKMSSWQILQHTMRTCGLYGLYAGGVTSILREVVFSAGYFPLMEHIRKSGIFGTSNKKDRSVLSSTFMSGLVAASLMAWVTTPLEVVATRIQMSAMLLLQPLPDKMSVQANTIVKAAKKGKLTYDEKVIWAVKDPLQGAVINDAPVSEMHLTNMTKPFREEVKAYRRALQVDPMPFHLPPEKPIRRFSPLQPGRAALLAKSEESRQRTSKKTPLTPSSIYYDVSQHGRSSPIPFVPKPSVGAASGVYNFRSRPSVGPIYKK